MTYNNHDIESNKKATVPMILIITTTKMRIIMALIVNRVARER